MTHLFDPDDLGQTFKITLGSAEIEYQTYAAKNWKGHTSWLADHNGQTCRCIELGPLFWSAKLEATDETSDWAWRREVTPEQQLTF